MQFQQSVAMQSETCFLGGDVADPEEASREIPCHDKLVNVLNSYSFGPSCNFNLSLIPSSSARLLTSSASCLTSCVFSLAN